MAINIQLPRKIRPEDYPEETKQAIEILAGIYNPFIDDVYRVLSTPDRETIQYTINVGALPTKKLINPSQIKSTLISKIKGLIVINAVNLTTPGVTSESQPFLTWTIASNGLLNILSATGLQANSQYLLTIEIRA
jgi:hypothetical protein